MTEELPLDYQRARLEEALTTDTRVAEQGTHVAIEAGGLIVHGTVSTVQRRAAIDDVARQTLPGVEVRNDTTVVDLAEPDEEEPIR